MAQAGCAANGPAAGSGAAAQHRQRHRRRSQRGRPSRDRQGTNGPGLSSGPVAMHFCRKPLLRLSSRPNPICTIQMSRVLRRKHPAYFYFLDFSPSHLPSSQGQSARNRGTEEASRRPRKRPADDGAVVGRPTETSMAPAAPENGNRTVGWDRWSAQQRMRCSRRCGRRPHEARRQGRGAGHHTRHLSGRLRRAVFVR